MSTDHSAEIDGPTAAANLYALQARYFMGAAETRVEALLALEAEARGRILRSHLIEEIRGEEIAFRDAVDRLIEFAGWIEIGLACNCLTLELVRRESLLWEALNEPLVRRYYEVFYPQLLPCALRLRSSNKQMNYDVRDTATSLFMASIELDSALATPTVRGFLRILDDFSLPEIDGGSFDKSDFLLTLTDPDRFVRSLLGSQDVEDQQCARACLGFIDFLQFLRNFQRLLGRLDDHAFLQSALWHQYGYWFHLVSGQMGGVIAAALDELSRYIDLEDGEVGAAQESAQRATLMDMASTQHALRLLTSSVYRAPLESSYLRLESEASLTDLFLQLRSGRIGRKQKGAAHYDLLTRFSSTKSVDGSDQN